jgi:hypothetical protein
MTASQMSHSAVALVTGMYLVYNKTLARASSFDGSMQPREPHITLCRRTLGIALRVLHVTDTRPIFAQC